MESALGKEFKFAVILCALYPALWLSDETEGMSTSEVRRLITIPSVHVQGRLDTWKGQGSKVLSEYFDQNTVERIEIDLGHEVPSKPKDVAAVVSAIREIWKTCLA